MAFFSMTLVVKGLFVIYVILMVGPIGSNGSEYARGGVEEEGLENVTRPTRKLVAVEGVIYCKSCKFQGVNTFLGASPLSGGVARLQCNNSKRAVTAEGKTDKNGYFFIHTPNVTSYGVHKCKVYLGSSPLETCKNATDLNGGVTGATLKFHKVLEGPTPLAIYSSGPFAFAPSNTTSCPHSP
ncbi:non-classical arabinogalactan protein 31-like [Magnolia sinica]|uniref:non-classical arabinogalactan protein 31-like n=1 Tax=Magnolia sinica TaxID=86752 RepID=UPI0026590757|nr:non-classical arabinogalactan protein 31-like [Magnolia sinica]